MSKLPPGWIETTMGEVCEVVAGSTPKTHVQSYWNGDIPWITPDDLSRHNGKYIHGGARSITKAGYDSCSTHLVPTGTVLYTTRAPIGYAAIAAEPVCTNQGFKNFVPSEGVDSEYLYWYLRYATPAIREMGSGTTFKEVSGKVAKTIPVILPPHAEQRRIVEAIEEQLSRLDAAQASLSGATRLLRPLRASTLAAAASGALIGEDAGRWPKKRVADLAGGIRYGTSVKTGPKGVVPVLRMGNVVDGRLVLRDLKYLPKTHHEFPDLLLQPGDVLFNRTNSPELVGKAAVYRGRPSPCSYASYLIRVRMQPGYEPDLLAYFLNSPYGRDWARSVVSQQVGQANINGTKLKALEVPVPREDQQRHIVDEVERRLSMADALHAVLLKSVARAGMLERAVLREAFGGRLVRSTDYHKPGRNSLEVTGV